MIVDAFLQAPRVKGVSTIHGLHWHLFITIPVVQRVQTDWANDSCHGHARGAQLSDDKRLLICDVLISSQINVKEIVWMEPM